MHWIRATISCSLMYKLYNQCLIFCKIKFQVLDNTINKVAEEILSREELEERQVKIQVSNDQPGNQNLQFTCSSNRPSDRV